MRKVLNILESCSLAYDDITMAKVFEVTGRPSPDEISQTYEWLKKSSFTAAY